MQREPAPGWWLSLVLSSHLAGNPGLASAPPATSALGPGSAFCAPVPVPSQPELPKWGRASSSSARLTLCPPFLRSFLVLLSSEWRPDSSACPEPPLSGL